MQGEVVNDPVPLVDIQLTDPVGEDPVTVAVQVVNEPNVPVEGEQETATVVAVRAELTVSVADAVDVALVDVASVTRSSKLYVSPAVRVLAAIEHVSVALATASVPLLAVQNVVSEYPPAPLTCTVHCQEYGEVPVDGMVPLTISVWVVTIVAALSVGAEGAVRAELTVTE